jgi:hypothetical protein
MIGLSHDGNVTDEKNVLSDEFVLLSLVWNLTVYSGHQTRQIGFFYNFE